MAKKVVTFGELMLRLAPEGYYRFVQADTLGATFGGGEANVAVSLANYGLDAKFVSKLPTHEIGQAAVNSLRKYGVDTTDIVRGGDRVGIYYLEKGASQRPSKVIYDRAGSSIATASKSDFDWKKIFEGVSWFHFTGITPALNDEVAEICLEACKAAKEAGVTISCDLNYRNKLWSKEKAGKVMAELCQYVDVCIANEEDAADVFGITSKGTDVTTGTVNHEGYKDVAKQLADRFGFEKVAITLRESISANDNNWSAMLYDGKDYYFSKKYKMHIVDRVGGGDHVLQFAQFAVGLGLVVEFLGLLPEYLQPAHGALQREVRPHDAHVVGHDGLHLAFRLDDHQHLFGVLRAFEIPVGDALLKIDLVQQRRGVACGLVGVDDRLDQRVRGQAVGAVQPRARGFAQRVEPLDRRFAVEIDLHAAAAVVRRGGHGNPVLRDVDADRAAFLVDVREVAEHGRGILVRHVEVNEVLAPAGHFSVYGAGNGVARRR